MNAYTMRGAAACMHSHSVNAVMATMLCGDEFRISGIEMIKGIRRGSTKTNFGCGRGCGVVYRCACLAVASERRLFREALHIS